MKKCFVLCAALCSLLLPSLFTMSMEFDSHDACIENYLIQPSSETDNIALIDLLVQTNVQQKVLRQIFDQHLINAFNLLHNYCSNGKLCDAQKIAPAYIVYNAFKTSFVTIPTIDGVFSDDISDFHAKLFALATEKAKDLFVTTKITLEKSMALKIFNLAHVIAYPNEPTYTHTFEAYVFRHCIKLIIKTIDITDGKVAIEHIQNNSDFNNIIIKQRGVYQEKLLLAQKNFHAYLLKIVTQMDEH
jgi:hypothetical protein